MKLLEALLKPASYPDCGDLHSEHPIVMFLLINSSASATTNTVAVVTNSLLRQTNY